jgi:5-methylcytosine-specific restriction enzyme subunit McrC
MRVVELREYATEPDVPLTWEQRDQLSRLVSSLNITPSPGSAECYHLTPSSVVGAVTLDDLQVIVQPKLEIDHVLFLISYALDPSDWISTPSPLGESDSLFEALIPSFLHHVEAAIDRGLLRDYVSVDDSLSTVRGRIRVGEQLALHHGRVPPLEVSFDDYTEEIPENQLLAAATDRLLQLRVRSDRLIEELQRSRRQLSGISPVGDLSRVASIRWTRLNEHYRPAVGLAALVLRGAGIDLQQGDASATSFLLDMNDVFEDFVYAALRDKLRLDEHSFPQGGRAKRLFLDDAARVQLRPDLSWWQGKRCYFVGDVKYKRTAGGEGKHPDLYQLLAYVTAAHLDEGLLIYAAGEAEPVTHEIRLAGKRLRVVTLNLAGSPHEVLRELDGVADYIVDVAGRSPLGVAS